MHGGRRKDGARVGVRRVAGPRAAVGLPASREKAQGESSGRSEVPPRGSCVAVVGVDFFSLPKRFCLERV